MTFSEQTINKEMVRSDENAVFDFEKKLSLPKLSTGIAFYLLQVWLCNMDTHMIFKVNIKHTSIFI